MEKQVRIFEKVNYPIKYKCETHLPIKKVYNIVRIGTLTKGQFTNAELQYLVSRETSYYFIIR